MTRAAALLALAAAFAPGALAQSSASFQLGESVLTAGGRPEGGAIAQSASFRLSLDTLGEGPSGVSLASASFRGDAGFVARFLPPGEADDLRLTSAIDLAWSASPRAASFNLYRDLIGALPGSSGSCLEAGVGGTTTSDPDVPPPGLGFFYLVTAENRLGEEGTRGRASDGSARVPFPPCP